MPIDPEMFKSENRDQFISYQLDQLDKWEARHNKRIELTMKDRITVDSNGVAVVTYEEGEFETLYLLHNQAMKIRLLWESSYSWISRESLFVWEYVGIVIDQRLGLRKGLSSRTSSEVPKLVRAAIREQVDGIIAALGDIDKLTAGE